VTAGVCNAGYESTDAGATCTACATGKYKTAAGNTECTTCAKDEVNCGGTFSGQAVSKLPEEVGGGVGGAIVAIALAYYFYSRYFVKVKDDTKNTAAIDLEMAGDQIPKSDDIPSPLFPEAGAKAPAAPAVLPASKKPTEPEFQASL
jgi:hypothetical protein